MSKPKEKTPGIRPTTIKDLKRLLAEIEVQDREWYGPGKKAREEERLVYVGARLPGDLAEEIKELPGRITHHVERALKLYLRVREVVRESKDWPR